MALPRERGRERGHSLYCRFFLALSMSPPLEMFKEVTHGFAAQQIRPGGTRRGVRMSIVTWLTWILIEHISGAESSIPLVAKSTR
jgi:hypothetical protein